MNMRSHFILFDVMCCNFGQYQQLSPWQVTKNGQKSRTYKPQIIKFIDLLNHSNYLFPMRYEGNTVRRRKCL